VSSVLRSHFELVGERERECERAVLRRKGVFGRRNFRRAVGVASMFCEGGRGD